MYACILRDVPCYAPERNHFSNNVSFVKRKLGLPQNLQTTVMDCDMRSGNGLGKVNLIVGQALGVLSVVENRERQLMI